MLTPDYHIALDKKPCCEGLSATHVPLCPVGGGGGGVGRNGMVRNPVPPKKVPRCFLASCLSLIRVFAATLLALLFIVQSADADHNDVTTGICTRTAQVHDAIVAATDDIGDCADITAAHLAAIMSLNLNGQSITSLKAGDFDGLSALTTLRFDDSRLETLPEEVFSGLSTLTDLDLRSNQFTTLPEEVFSGLSALTTLDLRRNPFTILPAEIFSDLPASTNPKLDPGVTLLATPVIMASTSMFTAVAGDRITAVTIDSSACGTVARYSISPAIGNGLIFDTDTGAISGTPTAAAIAVVYTITAHNTSGTDTAEVSITVDPDPDTPAPGDRCAGQQTNGSCCRTTLGETDRDYHRLRDPAPRRQCF